MFRFTHAFLLLAASALPVLQGQTLPVGPFKPGINPPPLPVKPGSAPPVISPKGPFAGYSSSDDRENSDPTGWWWFTGQSATQVGNLINSLNARIVDIYVENTNPYTFTVALVSNTGSYAKAWWWYIGLDAAGLANATNTNNARITSLKAYDIGGGAIRFTAVMVSNTGADAKGWWWYYGQTPADIQNAVNTNNARLVQINSYITNGVTRYATVMISNTGNDSTGWWYYLDATPATLSAGVSTNHARIVDLDYIPSTGHFNAIMETCVIGCPDWWWWYGFTPTQMDNQATQLGARIIDVNTYPGCGGVCTAAVMVDNSHATVGPAGVTGSFSKQVGGPVLSGTNQNFIYEPASSIKVLAGLYAMQQVQAGTIALTDQIPHYTNGPNSCPNPAVVSGTEPLSTAIQEMLWHSDNARTREVIDYFGRANIDNLAASIGMSNSGIFHIIGCGGPDPDQLTLVDAGKLYEGVANATLLTPYYRDKLFSLMAGKSEFIQEGYDFTGLWGTSIPAIISQEAPAGMTAAQQQAFLNNMNLAYKAGGYTLCPLGGCKKYLSITGWASIPSCSGSVVSGTTGYVFGNFFYAGPNTAATDNAFFAADAEGLRTPIHNALASCASIQPVTITLDTSPPNLSYTVDGIPFSGHNTFGWYPGAIHALSTSPTIPGTNGVRYAFNSWSDLGAITHSISVPGSDLNVTARYTTQFFVSPLVSPASSGTITMVPPGSQGFFDAGTQVTLTAVPNSGFYFSNWAGTGNGSYTGKSYNAAINVNAPITETGTFAAGSISSIRINSGAPIDYLDPAGRTWSADYGFSGGNTFTFSQPIRATTTPPLYQSERFGNFSYNFSVPNGTYNVRLKFAEIYFAEANKRRFNVAINGAAVLTNFDIVAFAGSANTPIDRVFQTVVGNGQINITFTGVVSSPKVSAIEILPAAVDVAMATKRVVLAPNSPWSFSASVVGSANTSINWSISPNLGSITSAGVYTAPAIVSTPQFVTVTATSVADLSKSDTAVVELLPGPWQDIDIGAPNSPGSSTYSSGAFNVIGGGDIGGAADSFHFTYLPLAGNGMITAYVWPYAATSSLKAGVMMRESLAPGAASIFQGLWANVVALQESRPSTGANSAVNFGAGNAWWVRLVRRGNVFTGYVSGDSVNWIPVGSPQTINMASNILVGLAVASSWGAASTSTFYDVSLNTPASVSVDQQLITLGALQAATFTATVTGVTNPAVTWSISPAVGSINPTNGIYASPGSLTGTPNVTVTATSVEDPTKYSTAVVNLSSSLSPIRVNAGGPPTITPDGYYWNGDTGASAGSTYAAGVNITGTNTPYIYISEHFNTGNFNYSYYVPNGVYNVTLKFAEIYFSNPGQRVFNVSINGATVLTNLDVVAAAGGPNRALDYTFPVNVITGQIVIQFTAVTSAPKVNAIQIQ